MVINPIDNLRKSIRIQRNLIVGLVALVAVTVYSAKLYIDSYYNDIRIENKNVKELNDKKAQEIERLKKDLERNEAELKKFNVQKQVISMYIKEKNPKVDDKEAAYYATEIIKSSNKYENVKHTVLTGLIDSESSFKKNVKHNAGSSIHIGVKGFTGVASGIWSKELIANHVIRKPSDLEMPKYAIAAGAYILNKYSKHQSTFEALVDYKSDCPLGRKQALDVLARADKIKRMEERYA
jgi:hypothetical protein